MIVIRKSGIAPMTTPVYRKYVAMQQSLKIIVIFCVLLLLSLMLSIFLQNFVWPPMCVEGIVVVVICAILAWMMSLRKERNKNYYLLDEDGDEEVMELTSHEVENVNPESEEMTRGGTTWEDGMTLPRPPRIRTVEERNQNREQNVEELNEPAL
jgi:hypothetical protein